MMKNRLLKISEKRKNDVSSAFIRYLYHEIDWNQRLVLITGARGSGKTTMLLQRFKQYPEKAVYLSLDDFYFESNRLLLLIEELYEAGYKMFYLDEVHQYQNWARDLKNLYDIYDDIKIIATGSSALKLETGKADLSRRISAYNLYGLSFREYLNYEYDFIFDSYTLTNILENHQDLSVDISDTIKPLAAFNDYLRYGYYPFYKSGKSLYHQKLQQIIRLILEVDLPSVENINFTTVKGMKRLLFMLSQIVPFTPNIQSLADKIDSTRNSILKALHLMEKSNLLNLLRSHNRGVSYLQKPDKIFLENPNLAFVFSDYPNKGSLRETFFFNQVRVRNDVITSKFSDFMVDGTLTFEIGGKAKSGKQLAGVPLTYIAADDIEYGNQNKIPLWLFGFLY